jgi:programmed cell death 6-interacting protein
MSNLLALPFKKTYNIDVKEPVRNYLLENGAIHPDAFKNDINRWQNLRKDGVGGVVHVDRVNAALRSAFLATTSTLTRALLSKLPYPASVRVDKTSYRCE